jgi:hypothetical protein
VAKPAHGGRSVIILAQWLPVTTIGLRITSDVPESPPGSGGPKRSNYASSPRLVIVRHTVHYSSEPSDRGIARQALRPSRTTCQTLEGRRAGLRTAIEQFDPSKDFHFPTYATWWIKPAMIQGGGGDTLNVREPKPPVPSSGDSSVKATLPTDRRTGARSPRPVGLLSGQYLSDGQTSPGSRRATRSKPNRGADGPVQTSAGG